MTKKKRNFFQKKDNNFSRLFCEIEDICDGLFYISETDAPVVAFTGNTVPHQNDEKAGEQVIELSTREFFERLTVTKDWFGPAEKARAEKFLALQKLIEENLTDVKVLRLGRIRVNIYVVGTGKDGCLTGFSTKAVET